MNTTMISTQDGTGSVNNTKNNNSTSAAQIQPSPANALPQAQQQQVMFGTVGGVPSPQAVEEKMLEGTDQLTRRTKQPSFI